MSGRDRLEAEAQMESKLSQLEQTLDRANKAAFEVEDEPAPEARSLRDLRLRMSKVQRAWGRPQSLGFFGPSQAGKSFLVGALLSHEMGTLEVLSRTGQVDFLKEINPAKGVESTGVVTRFSSCKAPAPLRRGDFYCRLLSLEVMLESMATGFLVECTSPAADPERITRVLREARLQSGPPAPAVFGEAWDRVWHNLLKKYQDRHPYLSELRRHPELRSESYRRGISSVTGWAQLYSILWGGRGYAKDVDRLADILIAGLQDLGHPEAVEVDLAHVRASAENPSVIDAACLNAVGQPQPKMVAHVENGGPEVQIEPSVLAALISEIRLPLAPVSGSLLERADLLDFPGGRALRGINGFEPADLNRGNLENAIEVYKRGKLTFLFEQFSLDREITALVLASPGPTKPEAIQMQHQVERWLEIRHGAKTPSDPEEIAHPSLFIALTKFDMSLGALRSDNAKDRWDSRVEEACVDFWARSHSSWVHNWGSAQKTFTNMFWIRNPYADQMNTLRPGTADFAEVKQGYHDSTAVRTYIGSHGEKWAAMEGDDEGGLPRSGIPLIASHLRAKLAEDIKAKELTTEFEAIRGEFLECLRMMTPSRDEEEARARLEQAAKSLVDALRSQMKRSYSGAIFGSFVELSTLEQSELEEEISSIYGTVGPMSIKVSDKVKKVMVHVLKYWANRAATRVRDSELSLPLAPVERYLREVCTSRKLLPILGKAIFPYFNRSELNFSLVATIMQVKISDALLHLFTQMERRTPEIPVRLSYSEVMNDTSEESEEVDWADVDFGDDDAEESTETMELVFAGNDYFEHWAKGLAPFYTASAGKLTAAGPSDPTTRALVEVLQTVEAMTR